MRRMRNGYYLSVKDIERLYNDCGELLLNVSGLLRVVSKMKDDCETPYNPPRDGNGILQFRRLDDD